MLPVPLSLSLSHNFQLHKVETMVPATAGESVCIDYVHCESVSIEVVLPGLFLLSLNCGSDCIDLEPSSSLSVS